VRKRWIPFAAAASVALIAAGGAGFALSGGDDEDAPAALTKTTLALPAPDSMGMCMQVTPEVLAGTDQALSGTATSVSDALVTITVDRWFKGGDSDVVELTVSDPDLVGLEGGIEFEQGSKYLVSATDGHVNSCGLTGLDEDPLSGLYQQAFSG
jgi:hypothetical protein